MNFTPACLECLYAQIRNFCQSQCIDSIATQSILKNTKTYLDSVACMTTPPPKIAIKVYENLAFMLHLQDPYQHIKIHSIESARRILENLQAHNAYADTLQDCLKVAALGNIIDYGLQHSFDFESDFNLTQMRFAHFDIESFRTYLQDSKTLLYIADNAGENLFDEVLLEHIKKHYPQIHITYLTRGVPIINDLTLQDLAHPQCAKIHTLADVRSSYMRSPGFIYDDAKSLIRQYFDEADVIVGKGMGNYECLESLKKDNLFLLFKVKCNVVSAHSGFELGTMVFLQNKGVENV